MCDPAPGIPLPARLPPARSARVLLPVVMVVLSCSSAGAAPAVAQEPGGFVLQFVPPEDAALADISELVEQYGRFQELIDEVNDSLELPLDVLVSFQEGEGPLYSPDDFAIVMSYEFLQLTQTLFEADDPQATPDQIDTAVLDSAEFVLFHEMGHALVDVLGLPVVGREEDAVDSLAAVLSIELVGEGEMALNAAITFDLLAGADADGVLEEADFWDEHSLNEQRFYAIVCWVYGSDPELFQDLVTDGWLPEEKAVSCPMDYEQQANSWVALLADYLR